MIRAIKAIGVIASTAIALVVGGGLAMGISAATQSPAARPAASACTRDTLEVGYSIQYSPALAGYAVTDVTLTDTSPAPDLGACAGAAYSVTLRDAGGAALGTLKGTVPIGVTSFSPAAGFATPVDASAVAGVSLDLS